MNFIERNTKKVALILGLATAVSAVTTVYAAQNSDGWHGSGAERIYKEEGQIKVNGWVFDEAGSYYLNAEGNPVTAAWQTVNGSTYYFDKDGHRVNGKQVIDGHEYTFQKSGVLLTGWNEAKDTYYDEFGKVVTGIQSIEGKTYNFDENGKIVSGWSKVNDKKVYFNADGSMAVGETTVDGKKYNFNEDGTVTTGWKTVKGEKYYYNDYGFMTKGWKTIDGDKYYFNKKGQAATDTEYAGYEFDEDGVAKKIKKKEVKSENSDDATSETNSYDDDEESTGTTSSSSRSASSSKSLGNADGSIASAALSQIGVNQDCTALATNALAARGIYFHGWPAEYMSLGSITSDPQPGDLIYYDDAGAGVPHIAVYVGGGQAVHGGWLGGQTVESTAYIGSGPVFIRVGQ